MSQSPVAESELQVARDAESNYRQALQQVNHILRHHGSLSGREANCAFLNTRGSAFANIASVSGFDFLDDARALAITDWDHDGDVDVWVTNRTSPRVRFLRNDTPTSHHWVNIRLRNRDKNRDGIGARLELTTPDANQEILAKSVRAGEGFLAQSSNWIHFGLGTADRIETLVVHWPDGTRQEFHDLAADRHWIVTQQAPLPEEWQRPQAVKPLQPSFELERADPTETARVPLFHPVPLPRFPAAAPQDPRQTVELLDGGGVTLVNLWASWCGPCLQELETLKMQQDRLSAAGIRVVALCADPAAAEPVDAETTRSVLDRLALPFPTALATPQLMARWQAVHDFAFPTHVDVAVPSSLLVDGKRQVAVIYRGAVTVNQILKDATGLSLAEDVRRTSVFPAGGRWNQEPARPFAGSMVRVLLDQNATEDAIEFVAHHHDLLSTHDDFADLCTWLGDALAQRNAITQAIAHYERALAARPDHLAAQNNLAWYRATAAESSLRDGTIAVKWAEQAARQTQGRETGVLDTLAAAYAEAGRFEDAVKVIRRALQLTDPDADEQQRKFQQRLQLYQQQQPFRQPAGN